MTNIEKYREELIRFAMADGGFAVIDDEPILCTGAICSNCLFTSFDNCEKGRFEWLDKEYKENKSCKTCGHFHRIEGFDTTGVCDVIPTIIRTDDTCCSYKRRSKDD